MAWTLLSIIAVHAGHYEPVGGEEKMISARADNPRELAGCHRELEKLLADLHRKAVTLQENALKFQTAPAVEWKNWSSGWRRRWQMTDRHCRLTELGGQGVSAEIDQMETIHAALAELQLSYGDIVERYVVRYIDRLRRLRNELSAVRRMIDRRQKPGGSNKRAEAAGEHQVAM